MSKETMKLVDLSAQLDQQALNAIEEFLLEEQDHEYTYEDPED